MNGFVGNVGPHLSDDQFLQWGQNPAQVNPYQEMSNYNLAPNTYPPNPVPTSTQLTRRPINQLTTRARPLDQSSGLQWMDPAANTTQQTEGAWGDDIEELERKAQIAKRDAQAKRKQIPPFVQKLNRFVMCPTEVRIRRLCCTVFSKTARTQI